MNKQRTCAYCGGLFSFVRATKKYCSDNCKQMAYFTRNGFVPVHEFGTDRPGSVTVKDVKYGPSNIELHTKIGVSKSDELQIVTMYAKCLIRNLLQLSRTENIERGVLLEFTATWSQFARWPTFQKTRNDFSFYDLIVDLNPKLMTLAKSNFENNLVELVLSEKISSRLQESLNEMSHVQNLRFDEMQF